MFKLMDKKIIAILRKLFLLYWPYASLYQKCSNYIDPLKNMAARDLYSDSHWSGLIHFGLNDNYVSPCQGRETIRIYHECKGRTKDRRLASQGLPSDDKWWSRGTDFLSYPHWNNGFFFLLTTVFFFKISFQKFLNKLRCNFTWWCHLNITMTSLDDNVREFQYNQCMKPSRDSLGKIAWVR